MLVLEYDIEREQQDVSHSLVLAVVVVVRSAILIRGCNSSRQITTITTATKYSNTTNNQNT